MKELKYFKHCKSLDEVKAEYKRCVKRWLQTSTEPGDSKQMVLVDEEYLDISHRPKFLEQPEDVRDEFNQFPEKVKQIALLGLNMEVCGSWLWVSGNTREHKEALKELGLRYSPNKMMWYYRPKWYRSSNSTPVDMEFIRKKYGTDHDDGGFVFDRPNEKRNAAKPKEEVLI